MSDEIRIIVADDHPIVRRGLVQVIAAETGLKVIAEASDGNQALGLIRDGVNIWCANMFGGTLTRH